MFCLKSTLIVLTQNKQKNDKNYIWMFGQQNWDKAFYGTIFGSEW